MYWTSPKSMKWCGKYGSKYVSAGKKSIDCLWTDFHENRPCTTAFCKALLYRKKKVKWSCYRPGVAQRVRSGITLIFHDRGTRRGWVVSSTPRPYFTCGKDPVPILQEAGWAPGPVWAGEKSRPHWDSISDRPARSQSLYWLSYQAHITVPYFMKNLKQFSCWYFVTDRQMDIVST